MIIDGSAIASEIQREIKEKIQRFPDRPPCLAVVSVGNHPPSKIYITRKTKACAHVGIRSIRKEFPDTVPEKELLKSIEDLNKNHEVDGILVQLPLPSHIAPHKVTACIDPNKDVDGFHPLNVGKMLIGQTDGFFPCTPLGIKAMLDRCHVNLSGKHVVILGRSNIVGKPMAAMLMQSHSGFNATVTVVHRQSLQIRELCQIADVLIAAVGQPLYVKGDMVKEGAVVIDVGINKILNDKESSGCRIVGDVDFEQVKEKCSFISPVPGGVGPMTIAMLLSNTLKSYFKNHSHAKM